jgi:hypothetical protein
MTIRKIFTGQLADIRNHLFARIDFDLPSHMESDDGQEKGRPTGALRTPAHAQKAK